MNNSYVFKLLLFFDMFVCAVIWRDSGITISSMTGLALRKQSPPVWARVLGGFLNWLQAGHCESAIAHDIVRANEALAILQGK